VKVLRRSFPIENFPFPRTHLLGCIMFIGAAIYFLVQPAWEINWEEKMIFSAFFIGAILCLGFSFTFHTVSCHSEVIGKLFSK
jgi:adiponectin receptor